jgi:methylated-DNA-[protein]-cysteine S-methyltransferase
MHIKLVEIESPLGGIVVAFQDDHVVGLEFADQRERLQRFMRQRFGQRFEEMSLQKAARLSSPMQLVCSRIRAYFNGDINALENISVDLCGTAFQKQVWTQLRRIRPGTTASYGDLACQVRRPQASRAVGAANGANPVALIVPCHRVIGSDGSLTGYAGGIDRKRWLLQHEGAVDGRDAGG